MGLPKIYARDIECVIQSGALHLVPPDTAIMMDMYLCQKRAIYYCWVWEVLKDGKEIRKAQMCNAALGRLYEPRPKETYQ